MPITDLHKRKFKKNIAILVGILVWMVVIAGVAIIKMTPPG